MNGLRRHQHTRLLWLSSSPPPAPAHISESTCPAVPRIPPRPTAAPSRPPPPRPRCCARVHCCTRIRSAGGTAQARRAVAAELLLRERQYGESPTLCGARSRSQLCDREAAASWRTRSRCRQLRPGCLPVAYARGGCVAAWSHTITVG